MQKEVEVHGFQFSFTLVGVERRDKSFEMANFNYGGGSFYQKFKAKVPVELHDDLKVLKDVDVYINDGFDNKFTFITTVTDQVKVRDIIKRVLRVCKAVHKTNEPVEVSIVKRLVVEESTQETME